MRNALSRVVAWLSRRSDRSGEADKTGDESGGAGSRLDASVNQGHGQGDPRAASEMAAVQEQADRLTQTDQHRE